MLVPLSVCLLFLLPKAISQQYPPFYAIDVVQQPPLATPYRLIDTEAVYESHWDTLSQVRFWRRLIRLSPDSSLVSVAATREVLACISSADWASFSGSQQVQYLSSLRKQYTLSRAQAIYVTAGKADYYQLHATIPDINQAIGIFEAAGIEPWYAQTILMIESPGALRKSSAGARGAFQLMEYVAKNNGLTINGEVDERTDLSLSAVAAARFIRETCLPETRRLLRYRGISYAESDLWFRLLVLHVYHAGSQNVSDALNTFRPRSGGMKLIQQLWRAKTKDFRNASQNYSQVALATWLELEAMVYREYDVACEGERIPLPARDIQLVPWISAK